MELTPVNASTLQAALDDAAEVADLELAAGTYGAITVPKQKRRVTIRIPAGRSVEWNGAGGSVLRRTETSPEVNVRLVIEGELRTDRERTVTGTNPQGEPTYAGEEMEAVRLDGVDELVILGRGAVKDIYGKLGIEMNSFRDRVSIGGDILRRYLDHAAIVIHRRYRLPAYGMKPTRAQMVAIQVENSKARARRYVPEEWD